MSQNPFGFGSGHSHPNAQFQNESPTFNHQSYFGFSSLPNQAPQFGFPGTHQQQLHHTFSHLHATESQPFNHFHSFEQQHSNWQFQQHPQIQHTPFPPPLQQQPNQYDDSFDAMDIDDESFISSLTAEINNIRSHHTTVAEMPKTITNTPTSKLLAAIVIDTNYWISHSGFCAKLIDLVGPNTPILIPKVVLVELDGLKGNGIEMNSRGHDVKSLARVAGSMIRRALGEQKGNIGGQKDGETLITAEQRAFEKITNDDLIVDYAKYCAKFLAKKVFLLSNDNILCSKAMIEGIDTRSNYRDTPKAFKDLVSGNVSPTKTPPAPEFISSTSNRSIHDPSNRDYKQAYFSAVDRPSAKRPIDSKRSSDPVAAARARYLDSPQGERQRVHEKRKNDRTESRNDNHKHSSADSHVDFKPSDKPETGSPSIAHIPSSLSTPSKSATNDPILEVMLDILRVFSPILKPAISKLLQQHHNIDVSSHFQPPAMSHQLTQSRHAPKTLSRSTDPEELVILKLIRLYHSNFLQNQLYTSPTFLEKKLPNVKSWMESSFGYRRRNKCNHSKGAMEQFFASSSELWDVCRVVGMEREWKDVQEMIIRWKGKVTEF